MEALRAPGLLEALERALALRIGVGTARCVGRSPSEREHELERLAPLQAELAAVRAAAARALARLAAVPGRDEWAARQSLLAALVVACLDEAPAARTQAAAAICALARQPSVRVRAALRGVGAVDVLRGALGKAKDGGARAALRGALERLAL